MACLHEKLNTKCFSPQKWIPLSRHRQRWFENESNGTFPRYSNNNNRVQFLQTSPNFSKLLLYLGEVWRSLEKSRKWPRSISSNAVKYIFSRSPCYLTSPSTISHGSSLIWPWALAWGDDNYKNSSWIPIGWFDPMGRMVCLYGLRLACLLQPAPALGACPNLVSCCYGLSSRETL